MKAKFINETITDVLKPKAKDEIENIYIEEFVRKNGVTPEQAAKLVDDLKELGVDVKLVRPSNNYVSDSPIKIEPYRIFEVNRVVAECPTREMAEKMLLAFTNLTMDPKNLKIEKDSGSIGNYTSVKNVKKLISRLRMGIKTTMFNDKFFNVNDKFDNDEYWNWEFERREKDK